MKRLKQVKEILNKRTNAVLPIFGDIDGFFIPNTNPDQPVWYLKTDDNEKQ